MVPTNAPGVKFICRTSYEMTATVMGSPFDYPLSSRLDENDAVFIMDKVLVPWENVFVYGDVEKANNFFPRTGFLPRFVVHGCTRLAVKLDFIAGLLLKAVEAAGTKDYPRRAGQCRRGDRLAQPVLGACPTRWCAIRSRGSATTCCRTWIPATPTRSSPPWPIRKVKYIIEQTVASGLIYLNSPRRRFQEPGDPPLPRPLPARLERLQGRRAREADEAAVGLHRRPSSAAATSSTRSTTAARPRRSAATACSARRRRGNADRFKGFAEQCMAEYDLDGWTVPDLIGNEDVSYFGQS